MSPFFIQEHLSFSLKYKKPTILFHPEGITRYHWFPQIEMLRESGLFLFITTLVSDKNRLVLSCLEFPHEAI